MSQPNILLLIFDACRSEELRSHGRTFSNLAEKNVLFTNAFAPSHWSLPAHASILTGEYPSEHGLCTHDSSLSQESIVTKLSLEGYFTAGVSANRIFSSNYGFDAEFDRFEYTMSRSWLNQRTAGIDISKAVEDAAQQGLSGVQKYRYVVEAVLTHSNTLSSLYNLCDSGLFTLLNRLPLLDTLHPWFNPRYSYSAQANTAVIQEIISEYAGRSPPFFIVANYMDTHYPYYPREQFSSVQEWATFWRKRRLNEKIGDPFSFVGGMASNTIDNTEIETIQELYAGEVRTLDRHLDRIATELEEAGVRDETFIIVTADHGEDLGGPDDRGFRRMGHHESVSNHLLNIPLLIINPDVSDELIREFVELRSLSEFIIDIARQETVSTDRLTENTGPVVVECPAVKVKQRLEQYPDIPETFLRRYLFEHMVVVFQDDWKLAVITNGEEWAWQDGVAVPISSVPEEIRSVCEEHLKQLCRAEPLNQPQQDSQLDDETERRLADLGYL